ncbi:MAG: hypothetical protein E6H82_14450 [Chloroflexi bacterium]|nr:MAG: hypothetical protein E6H82_14450 [Chloroflexota bacterium]
MFPSSIGVPLKRLELAVIGILILGIIGYAGVGIVSAGSRVATADRTLNSVVSHQNTLNATFSDINAQLGALTSNATFNPRDAVALVDKSVASSELASKTINSDDASLTAAQKGLHADRWLTMVGSTNLDREANRIAHARNALAAARTIATDKALEGRFWRSLYSGLADLATLNGQSSTGDLAGARTTLATMKTDIDQAAEQSAAPPLPSELGQLTKDLQAFVDDYGKKLDAESGGDDAGAVASQAGVDADLAKIAKYTIDSIGKQIDDFYRPMIARFNLEIAAATA